MVCGHCMENGFTENVTFLLLTRLIFTPSPALTFTPTFTHTSTHIHTQWRRYYLEVTPTYLHIYDENGRKVSYNVILKMSSHSSGVRPVSCLVWQSPKSSCSQLSNLINSYLALTTFKYSCTFLGTFDVLLVLLVCFPAD